MLNLEQLLKRTPKDRIDSAAGVKILSPVSRSIIKKNPVLKADVFSAVNPKGERVAKPTKYKLRVENLDGADSKFSEGNLKVSCTCSDFWATWEYALNKKGAADIKYCNGQPPDIKNPRRIPGVCKHLYRFLKSIKSKNM